MSRKQVNTQAGRERASKTRKEKLTSSLRGQHKSERKWQKKLNKVGIPEEDAHATNPMFVEMWLRIYWQLSNPVQREMRVLTRTQSQRVQPNDLNEFTTAFTRLVAFIRPSHLIMSQI